MSEEQQAVLDENQEDVTTETQGAENQEAATQKAQVDSATTEDATPEKDNVQKRIDKLTAEKYAEKRQREALEERLASLEASKPQAAVVTEGKPTLEQFDFDDSQYQAALISYEVKQQVEAERVAAQKAQSQAKQREIDASFDNAEVKYATDNPEYINDVQNLPRFNDQTLSVIKGQENAPNLVHYLSKNPETAHTIASLDPISAAVQIGTISANLAATTKPAVQTSTAPDPIIPVTTGGSIGEGSESPFIAGAKFE